MIRKTVEEADLDDLLRRALADDLPTDVEAGMRERIRLFRVEGQRFRAGTGVRSIFLRRTVWAAISILMLAAGIVLQGSRFRTPLGDRIAAVKMAQRDVTQPRTRR